MQLPLWLGTRWHLLQLICLCNLSSMTKQCWNGHMCHLWIKLAVNPFINMHIFTCDSILFIIPRKWNSTIRKTDFDTIFVPSSFTNSCYKCSWQVAKLKNEGKFRCQRHICERWDVKRSTKSSEGGSLIHSFNYSFINSFIHICHVDEKGFKTLLSLFIGWGMAHPLGGGKGHPWAFQMRQPVFVCFGYLQNWNHSLNSSVIISYPPPIPNPRFWDRPNLTHNKPRF